jgi:hypothetical protein
MREPAGAARGSCAGGWFYGTHRECTRADGPAQRAGACRNYPRLTAPCTARRPGDPVREAAPRVGESFLRYLDRLQPTGQGNPEAVFISRDLEVLYAKPVGADKQHLRFSVGRAVPPLMRLPFARLTAQTQCPRASTCCMVLRSTSTMGDPACSSTCAISKKVVFQTSFSCCN